jgi:hypothetical protein
MSLFKNEVPFRFKKQIIKEKFLISVLVIFICLLSGCFGFWRIFTGMNPPEMPIIEEVRSEGKKIEIEKDVGESYILPAKYRALPAKKGIKIHSLVEVLTGIIVDIDGKVIPRVDRGNTNVNKEFGYYLAKIEKNNTKTHRWIIKVFAPKKSGEFQIGIRGFRPDRKGSPKNQSKRNVIVIKYRLPSITLSADLEKVSPGKPVTLTIVAKLVTTFTLFTIEPIWQMIQSTDSEGFIELRETRTISLGYPHLFIVDALGPDGTKVTSKQFVDVIPDPLVKLGVDKFSVKQGETFKFFWEANPSVQAVIMSKGKQIIQLDAMYKKGSKVYKPDATGTYTLWAKNELNVSAESDEVTVTVNNAPPPPPPSEINEFTQITFNKQMQIVGAKYSGYKAINPAKIYTDYGEAIITSIKDTSGRYYRLFHETSNIISGFADMAPNAETFLLNNGTVAGAWSIGYHGNASDSPLSITIRVYWTAKRK